MDCPLIQLHLMIVVSDRIARVFTRTADTGAMTFGISKVINRVWHAGLLFHKLKSYGISGRVFSLISSFFSNRRLEMILDGMSLQER